MPTSPGAFAGVGGFANITAKTATVVFCLTFDTKGLAVEDNDGIVTIKNEGSIPKFVNDVRSISFSGKRALANRQRVIYVTERCVFELTEKGLKLIEVYPGIDLEHDILASFLQGGSRRKAAIARRLRKINPNMLKRSWEDPYSKSSHDLLCTSFSYLH